MVDNSIIVSHYCWVTSDKMIITSTKGDYYIYNLNDCLKEKIDNEYLIHDGHPSYLGNGLIITDTYPLRYDRQHVFIADISNNHYEELLEVYSDPRLFEEKRCDTHPRVTADKKYVTIDSSFRNGERCVIEMALGEG